MKKEPVICLAGELEAFEHIDMGYRVNSLERKGWIERKVIKGQGNKTFIQITSGGKKVVIDVLTRMEGAVKEFKQTFSTFGEIQDLEFENPLAIKPYKPVIKRKDVRTRGQA